MNLNSYVSRLGKLGDLPRVSMTQVPTPLDSMSRISRLYGHEALFAKRDDCNGIALGGNKVRQLEFYFGDAIQQGADAILVTGAVQSNFARLTAAFAAKLGMECHLQLEARVSDPTSIYKTSGNVLLEHVLGARLHYYDDGEDEAGANRSIQAIAGRLRKEGRSPYVIPLVPGHPPFGALGYVLASAEILDQIKGSDQKIDEIFVASGSGNTHAGLLFGLRALDSEIHVIGSCVRRDKSLQFERIRTRCVEISELLELDSPVADSDIELTDEHFAPGYGKASKEVWDAIRIAARNEALFVDPTYTGKAMAAFLKRIKQVSKDTGLLFLHTGGTPNLFAYQNEVYANLGSDSS